MAHIARNQPDLIDTQWNVNDGVYTPERIEAVDLIDTQWNVNGDARHYRHSAQWI